MTEASSIEFIGYSTSKMAAQSHSQGIIQKKCVKLFQYYDWLCRYWHLELE